MLWINVPYRVVEIMTQSFLVSVFLFLLYTEIEYHKRLVLFFDIIFAVCTDIMYNNYDGELNITILFFIVIYILNKFQNLLPIVALVMGYLVSKYIVKLVRVDDELLFYEMLKLLTMDTIVMLFCCFRSFFRKENRGYLLSFHFTIYVLCTGTILSVMMFNRSMERGTRIVLYVPVFVISMLYLAIIFLFELFVGNRENQERLKLQRMKNTMVQRQYESLRKKYEDISILKHDTKHHLQSLSILIYQNEIEKAKEYIIHFADYMKESSLVFHSSNMMLEIIMNEKYSEAVSNGIEVTMRAEEVSLLHIDDIDLITVFGNIWDNAIEASKSLQDKHIKVSLAQKGNYTVFEMRNSYHRINKKGERLITTKSGHEGLGLVSIQRSIEKYNGILQVDYDEINFWIAVFYPSGHFEHDK